MHTIDKKKWILFKLSKKNENHAKGVVESMLLDTDDLDIKFISRKDKFRQLV